MFACLPPGGARRRVLKFSYGDDFEFALAKSLRHRLSLRALVRRAWRPDRRRFAVECPAAWRARSFHVEVAIPEELRFDSAVLLDFGDGQHLSTADSDVNRASLYASGDLDSSNYAAAYVEIAPERSGRTTQAAVASSVVAGLLWLGVYTGLDASNPGPAVSILLAGAALFTGVTAGGGEHALARKIFAPPRRWLLVATGAALAGSASLAMEVPTAHPVSVWFVAAIASSLAAIRLVWSAARAPG